MRSGGWIELQDLRIKNGAEDGTQPEDYVFDRSGPLIKQAYLDAYGFDVELPDRLPEELRKAGFINIREEVYRVPIGTWPRDEKRRYFGYMNREILLTVLNPLASKPMLNLGMPQSDLNALISEMEETLNNNDIHSYTVYGVIYGQKP
jgi:hypothetical protein